MGITRWEPFNEFVTLRDAMDHLFEESMVRPARALGLPSVAMVPLDIYQSEGNLVVKAPLPGLKAEDIDISVVGDQLTIKGEMKQEQEVKDKNVIRQERRYGAFSRTVSLPTLVDTSKADATFEDGVLTLTLPVAEEAKPKAIRVQSK